MEPIISAQSSQAGFEITRVMFMPQERDYTLWQKEINDRGEY